MSGQVLAGGELVTLAGSTVDTGIPIMMLLVKGSSTATNATLNGTYHAVSLAIESSPTQWIATSARFTADGAGSLVLDAFTTNANGVITEVPAVGLARPYTVSPDGTFNPATGFLGGVSPSGNFAIFAGETTGAGAPEIWFMLR